MSHAAALKEIQQAFQDGWIKPQALREGKIARLLATTLDPGEAEAIALALELSADLILLDERDGARRPNMPGCVSRASLACCYEPRTTVKSKE